MASLPSNDTNDRKKSQICLPIKYIAIFTLKVKKNKSNFVTKYIKNLPILSHFISIF